MKKLSSHRWILDKEKSVGDESVSLFPELFYRTAQNGGGWLCPNLTKHA
jgi:hypothetical protein